MVQLSLRTHPVELELARCLLAHSLLSDPGPLRGGAREAGGSSFQHGVPSARMAREGAPALSGEGRPAACALEAASTSWARPRQSRRKSAGSCQHQPVLCIALQCLLARLASCFPRSEARLAAFSAKSRDFWPFRLNFSEFRHFLRRHSALSLEHFYFI